MKIVIQRSEIFGEVCFSG